MPQSSCLEIVVDRIHILVRFCQSHGRKTEPKKITTFVLSILFKNINIIAGESNFLSVYKKFEDVYSSSIFYGRDSSAHKVIGESQNRKHTQFLSFNNYGSLGIFNPQYKNT